MDNSLASPNLAIVSYRIARDPEYLKVLACQMKAGVIEGGKEITAEEAAAMLMLLNPDHPYDQLAQDKPDGPKDAGELGTWIG
jgi:hypothetical protein